MSNATIYAISMSDDIISKKDEKMLPSEMRILLATVVNKKTRKRQFRSNKAAENTPLLFPA